MNAKNYNDLMEREISLLTERKSLLLHACCAPCASACLERLYESFDITVFFYNPNIEDGEYGRRKAELERLVNETGWAKLLDAERDTKPFYDAVRGLENGKEGGARCEKCFKLRLEKTAEAAGRGGYDYFATTLTLSPLKNADLINCLGEKIAEGKKVKWLYTDFKKKGGYLESLRLSKEYGLYRQNYCGCVYSKRDKI